MSYRTIPGGGSGLGIPGGPGFIADVNVAEVGGVAVVGTGVGGMMPVAGDVADNAVNSASYPVLVGAIATETPSLVTSTRRVRLITDLYRRLWVRTAGYSELLDAIRVSALNTIADDRDPAHQTWADATNLAAATYYYPSSAGHEIGNRDNLAFQLEATDGTFSVEVSNDGAVWLPATAVLVNVATGAIVGAATIVVGAATNYGLAWEKCEFRLIRGVWTTPDGTNDIELHVYTRAH